MCGFALHVCGYLAFLSDFLLSRMYTPEWQPYLVFFVNELGQSVYSPQDPRGTRFNLKNIGNFAADNESRLVMSSKIQEVFTNKDRTDAFFWCADYGDERRTYQVELHYITNHFAMVQLYRDEKLMIELTPTEHKVIRLLCNDKSDYEIAETLAVTPATIRKHIAHLKTKLNVEGRIRLGIEAYRLGLVKLRKRNDHIK